MGDQDVLGAFRVKVYDRTKYPGYAMNASFGNTDDQKPDLRCDMTLSGDGGANQAWYCSDACEQFPQDPNCGDLTFESASRVDFRPQFYNQVKFAVSSYDFASYGKVKVDLVGIKTGPDSTDKIMTTTDNPVRIVGRPATEMEMTLPVDRGEGQGTAGNKIADCGWEAQSRGGNRHIYDAEPLPELVDGDDDPVGDGTAGDALLTIEEYRGFVAKTKHIRTDPEIKDLFLWNMMPSGDGSGYISATSLAVHEIAADEFFSDLRIINIVTVQVPLEC